MPRRKVRKGKLDRRNPLTKAIDAQLEAEYEAAMAKSWHELAEELKQKQQPTEEQVADHENEMICRSKYA